MEIFGLLYTCIWNVTDQLELSSITNELIFGNPQTIFGSYGYPPLNVAKPQIVDSPEAVGRNHRLKKGTSAISAEFKLSCGRLVARA